MLGWINLADFDDCNCSESLVRLLLMSWQERKSLIARTSKSARRHDRRRATAIPAPASAGSNYRHATAFSILLFTESE